ncbi:nuclear transport factor 2 family protein [Serratia odorifera]|uniref:nuclear transport factor 2 family protein n=1 Tax=Serratia odorifera TaxID=618 RepID=UPI0023622F1F|nr:nuclear transport factor 2 family protein [Serratia odorifera]
MNTSTPSEIVVRALQQVVASPEHHPAVIADFFSQDYQQQVDGHTLDYAQFVQHMALLKQQTRSMRLNVLALAEQGETVLTHHRVVVEKCDGRRCEVQVLAHFTLCAGRIVRCDELTHLLSGDSADRDLGGRR